MAMENIPLPMSLGLIFSVVVCEKTATESFKSVALGVSLQEQIIPKENSKEII
jgi:hypothetical protein